MLDEYLERRDSIDRGICVKRDGGWFDYLCIYLISLLVLLKGQYVALGRLKVTSRWLTIFKLHCIVMFKWLSLKNFCMSFLVFSALKATNVFKYC